MAPYEVFLGGKRFSYHFTDYTVKYKVREASEALVAAGREELCFSILVRDNTENRMYLPEVFDAEMDRRENEKAERYDAKEKGEEYLQALDLLNMLMQRPDKEERLLRAFRQLSEKQKTEIVIIAESPILATIPAQSHLAYEIRKALWKRNEEYEAAETIQVDFQSRQRVLREPG